MVRRPLALLAALLVLATGGASQPLAEAATQTTAGTTAGIRTGAAATLDPAPGTFVALAPVRLLDTRRAVGVATTTPVPGGGIVPVGVAGRGGLPLSGVGAVVATLTVTGPAAEGYLVAWAEGTDPPATSALNWTSGQTVANTAVVPVGADGRLLLQNRSASTAHLVVDVEGYFAAGKPASSGGYVPLAPQRVLDTRRAIGVPTTTALPARSTTPVELGGRGDPAAGTSAVLLNVTAVGGTTSGYVGIGGPTALPFGGSVLTWAGSRPIASLVVAPLAADGTVSFYVGSAGPVHLVADIVGAFTGGTATDPGTVLVARPYRQLDTRTAGSGGALLPGAPRPVAPGAGPLAVAPGAASAVVVTLTVTNTTAPGYLTGYASGGTRPVASLVNWVPGQTLSTTVVLPVGADGRFVLLSGSPGRVDVCVDLVGTVPAAR